MEEKKIIKRNKEASIARIINATARIFAEQGYEKATYTEIAKLANLNISLISRYFGSKEKLLEATVNVLTSEVQLSFDSVSPKDTFEKEMHSLVDILTRATLEYPYQVKAIANIGASNKIFLHELYKIRQSNDMIYVRLKPFYDAGNIDKSHDLMYVVDTFIAFVNSLISTHYLTFCLPISNVMNRIHYVTELFIKGLAVPNQGPYPETFECIKESL